MSETLDEQIERVGCAAMKIADERNRLLRALREVLNAADRRETDPGRYEVARCAAINLLTHMIEGNR